MSVYSYVALKVHTNVRKVGTHLNVCFIYRTYVRWKYTYWFAYKKKRSIYLYNEHMFERRYTYTIFAPPFLILSLLYYIYIQKWDTLSRTFFTLLSAPLFTFILFYYILYIQGNTLPQLFPPIPLLLLYSLYI